MERRSNPSELGAFVRERRLAAGLSIRGLARAAGVDATGISRLENGDNDRPEQRTLASLARVLEVDLADLFALAGYQMPSTLPALPVYLRRRYDLTPEEVQQLAAHFELIRERHVRREGGRHDSHGA